MVIVMENEEQDKKWNRLIKLEIYRIVRRKEMYISYKISVYNRIIVLLVRKN